MECLPQLRLMGPDAMKVVGLSKQKHMMKSRFYKLIFAFMLGSFGGGISLSAAPELTYFIDVATFYDHEDQPYMEFYLDVVASSLRYTSNETGQFEGKVGVELKITDLLTQEEVYNREFELVNPDVADTSRSKLGYGIMDVRRISLKPGSYAFTGNLRDLNLASAKTFGFRQEMTIEKGKQEIAYLSDLTFSPLPQPRSRCRTANTATTSCLM